MQKDQESAKEENKELNKEKPVTQGMLLAKLLILYRVMILGIDISSLKLLSFDINRSLNITSLADSII